MNIYQVTFTEENNKLSKSYDSLDSHYIKNDKVCFSMKKYINTIIATINSVSETAIKFAYKDKTIITIKKIGETPYNVFEILVDENYCKQISTKIINEVYLETFDQECSPEVQERYQKDNNSWKHTSYSEF